jgi:hypothetical protein
MCDVDDLAIVVAGVMNGTHSMDTRCLFDGTLFEKVLCHASVPIPR